jgi:hypothetical protein
MRPSLDDILSGVQRLLQNDLVPALVATPFLVEQTLYATLLLEYGKKLSPRLHLVLAEEHGDLRATLAAVVAPLRSDSPDGATLAGAITGRLDDTTSDVASSTLDVLAQRNVSLRALVSEVVALLDAHDTPSPSAPFEAARAIIDAYLRRHAARQHHELQVLGVSW